MSPTPSPPGEPPRRTILWIALLVSILLVGVLVYQFARQMP
jgi:hypothetical protein